MPTNKPVVYIIHGDDDYEITRIARNFTKQLAEQLGDPAIAELNISNFYSENFYLNELKSVALSAPFISSRRLVIVHDGITQLKSKKDQEEFMSLLDTIPETTALILVENRSLTKDEGGKVLKSKHWLIKWSTKAKERVYVKECSVPKGRDLIDWIMNRAAEKGGKFTPRAAYYLSEFISGDTRMAEREIEKLILYVNNQRPVEVEDIQYLAHYLNPQGNYFEMIDSIIQKNGQRAIRILGLLLNQQDPRDIFWGLVNHFRRLLLTREMLDNNADQNEIAKTLQAHPYYAQNLATQANKFDIVELEKIYRKFLEYDKQIKSSQLDINRAIEVFNLTWFLDPKEECNYNATIFRKMLAEHGGVETAKRLLTANNPQYGFTALWECGRLDLTIEAHVLQPEFAALFTPEELMTAKQRLVDYGYKF